jgi:penicillin-binding protein 2
MVPFRLRLFALLAALAMPAGAQVREAGPQLAAVKSEPPTVPAAPGDVGFAPTWETQKHARTYLLSIPAPRGQIVDRNGEPLAQTRVSHNLAVVFPTPLGFSDPEVIAFVRRQAQTASTLLGRTLTINGDQALKHYKNRGVLPFVIAQDLKPGELEAFHRQKPANLTIQPIYLRFYPNGSLAGHIIGYAGRGGKTPDGPIENNELLWPNAEGREGLEQTFDAQLQGKMGQYNLSFDASGKRVSEQVIMPPQPGYNVVTTLDVNLQRLCEQTLEKGLKRGAMVITDPATGDILAMVPAISAEQFKALQDDPDIPLLPRAYRSAYPPGSTFKVFVGLAALQTGKIGTMDEYPCPPSMEIGNLTFRNWKKTHGGSLNFADALTQSCDTWFYQVGMKIGAPSIVEYASQCGLGKKTGLPLIAEAEGLLPTDEFMLRVHKRKLGGGDVANLSIGQGDTLTTPLQLAQSMAVIGNGGTLFQTRLVQQVQSIDGQIVNAYNVRMRSQVEIDPKVMKNVRRGMVQVVTGKMGTGGRASVPNVQVAGKTGTAQWGPKHKERTAAWFSGFAPAEDPKYAFAVVYEGEVNNDDVHGGTSAAPLMGKVLREVFKGEKPQKKKRKGEDLDEDDPDAQMEDEEDAPPRRSRVVEPPPPPPPPRRPPSIWKRIFG